MDTIDRYNPHLPAPFSDTPLRLPASISPSPHDLAIAPEPVFDPRVILRGLVRHWWKMLLLWLALSAPMVYLIFWFIQPTYEASSVLRVEPAAPYLFAPLHDQSADIGRALPYLETQVQLIRSNAVLEATVANPAVVQLPMLKASPDPINHLRNKLRVGIEPGAYMIRVALESQNAVEAATIVNAAVDAYRDNNDAYRADADKKLRQSLAAEEKRLGSLIAENENQLKLLLGKGTYTIPAKDGPAKLADKNEDLTQPAFSSVTEEQYRQTVSEMMRTGSDLMMAESKLNVLQEAMSQEEPSVAPADEELRVRIEEEFKRDPAVMGVMAQIKETSDHLEHVKSLARQKQDKSRVIAQKQLDNLYADYNDLWETKYSELSKRVRMGTGVSKDFGVPINELRMRVAELKKIKENQVKDFEKLQVTSKAASSDAFAATMLNHALNSLLERKDQVEKNIAQIDFQTNQEAFRVQLVDKASVPKVASNNKRLKYMTTVSLGLLVTILGLFLLIEIKAQRVADPDALSSRVRSKVYALPPLPTAREIRKLGAPGADEQIEQFIQRLDHIRFAVCGNSAELGKGRCVLITSAIGGEGKTTLAAQLAARCGNAGMSTLLIDADLRRSALCTLLDIPEGLGLSDVLKDEAAVEDVVIPVQGGTFVLLPAGTPIQDTSRVLQSRKLEALISQLRQVYDLIIIDSPPVLPVPDALVIGRCADGAVIASRYDISRFPQVERARHQLDSAGIAVLGTVINGMRHSESYYGTYTYSRRHSSPPESSDTL